MIDSISKWLVGSSSNKTLPLFSIILANIHLTFSPPDKTFTFFKASSDENNILPKKPLTKASSLFSENFLNHSTRSSLDSKYLSWFFGK